MRRLLNRKIHLWRDSKGVSAVEFAIIMPVLLMMLGGIIDFGNYYFISSTVNQAAETGARMAATGNTGQVVSYLQGKNAAYQVNITTDSGNKTVTVTVQLPVSFSFPGISAFFPSNPKVTGRCTMYDETA